MSFIVNIMAPSSVWTLATKSKDGKSATCNKCGKNFKNPSTSTIRYHMEQTHFIFTPKNPSNKQKAKDRDSLEAGSSEDDPEPTDDRSKVFN